MLNTYEALFVFSSSLNEESLKQVQEKISAEITRLGGSIDASRVLGKRAFSRPMKKEQDGLYAQMLLSLDPAQMQTLRNRFRLNEDILRSQVVRAEPPREEPASESAPEEAPPPEEAAAVKGAEDENHG